MPECRSCEAQLDPNLVFVDLGSMPLVNALLTSEQLDEPEVHYPLRALVCPRCLLVQLPVAPDPKILFRSDYPFYSGQSRAWVEHCCNLSSALITKHQLQMGRHHVLEIGSNDGTLLDAFQGAGFDVTGVEPCHEVAEASKAKGIPTWEWFWGIEAALIFMESGYRADLVLATNVLAHVPEPRAFLGGIREVLARKGRVVIEVPYVADMMAENRWDQIYHEHHCYFSLTSLSYLARKALLHVIDVEHVPVHGGSLRVTLGHLGESSPSPRVSAFLNSEIEIGLDRVSTYRHVSQGPNESRDSWWAWRPTIQGDVVGYGASAKAAVFCNFCGIDRDHLSYIVDTTPSKQGKYQPGTRIPIVGDLLLRYNPRTVVNFCWNWRRESEANIREHAPGARIVYPDELTTGSKVAA